MKLEIPPQSGSLSEPFNPPAAHRTLRDDFAGQALNGLVAGLWDVERSETLDGTRGGKRIATAAYMYADAMLEARKADA